MRLLALRVFVVVIGLPILLIIDGEAFDSLLAGCH